MTTMQKIKDIEDEVQRLSCQRSQASVLRSAVKLTQPTLRRWPGRRRTRPQWVIWACSRSSILQQCHCCDDICG